MTPIEAALARVRDLREAERKMTKGNWELREVAHAETPWSKRRVYRMEIIAPQFTYGKRTHSRDICQILDYCEWTDHPGNAQGIATLRNAAEPMLDLLEALLQREYVASDTGIDVERDARKKIAAKKINEALAAFVEGKDGT